MNRQILRNIIYTGLFLVPVIPFLVSGSFFFPFITTKAFAWRIIVEIIFAAWVLLACIDPVYRPKKTWTTVALLAFIAIIGIADLFGEAPVKSFWSNAERMEGFVSLLHLGMFFLVIRNVFDEIDWKRWWNTSLVASFLMSVYCIFQLLGVLEIHQSGARVDGTLGNAAYLAVYMLFHIFVALFYMMREKALGHRMVYGALALLEIIVLYHSATRGAILGILGGLLVAALIGMRNRENARMKKLSLAYIGIFTAIVLGFLALRHTAFVTSSPTLSRFASLNATELKGEGRSFVWPMALKGVKEHPILGWGQDNFNYVFNKYYDPAMYRLEPWFDRAHNIFLDWATQGGLLGLLAYLSLYYVLLRAMWKTDKFDAADKAVLTGLVAAYFFHNIFVFDHLVSYILFASLLAFVDSRTEAETVLEGKTFTETSVQNIGGPVALVALVIVMYFINVHPIIANASLISALQNLGLGNPQVAVQSLEKSYAAARLGRPEVVEQIASNSAQILSSSLSTEEKNAFFTFAQSAIEKQAAELPTDARYQLLAGSFFNTTGYFDKAAAYLDRAQELSPGKQMIYFERATVSINAGDYAKGLSMLKSAYELDTKNADAEVAYLVGAIFAGNRGLEEDLKADINAKNPALFNDDRIINAYLAKNRFADVIALFASRLANNPNDPQSYVNLAAAYLKAENKSGAITTLEKLGNNLPQYKTTADDYIAQIKNGTLK